MALVVETITDTGTEWGVSLTGSNPEAKDYIPCETRQEAFEKAAEITLEAIGETVAEARQFAMQRKKAEAEDKLRQAEKDIVRFGVAGYPGALAIQYAILLTRQTLAR